MLKRYRLLPISTGDLDFWNLWAGCFAYDTPSVFVYAVIQVVSSPDSPATVLLRHCWDGVLQPRRDRRKCATLSSGIPSRGLAFHTFVSSLRDGLSFGWIMTLDVKARQTTSAVRSLCVVEMPRSNILGHAPPCLFNLFPGSCDECLREWAMFSRG
jgi:hypothetical protein